MEWIDSKDKLEDFFCHHLQEVNQYIDQLQFLSPPPVYASVDIRESEEKYAPVDHNLFPAGFNNICPLDLEAISHKFKQYFKQIKPEIKSIVLLCESHTKNSFYLDHLVFLGKAIADGGYLVSFASFDEQLFGCETHVTLKSYSKFDVTIKKALIKDRRVILADSSASCVDLILLNNDQSSPIKDVPWAYLKTPVIPSPHLGWFKRKKHLHFKYYKEIADEFCDHFSIAPHLIQAKFKTVDKVDFASKYGLENLVLEVDTILAELPVGRPVFVKANQGTYGMGITVVSKGADLLHMNRRSRNKMNMGKNNIKFTSSFIQEGVGTVLRYKNSPAEITIYLIAGESLGGFMRINPEKTPSSNLNSKGMIFKKFCISEIKQNRIYKKKEIIYSTIARLSNLAASYEIKNAVQTIKEESLCKTPTTMC